MGSTPTGTQPTEGAIDNTLLLSCRVDYIRDFHLRENPQRIDCDSKTE